MIFVAIAGVLNIGLDALFIGPFDLGAAGAALATVLSEAGSVLLAFLAIRKRTDLLPSLTRKDLVLQGSASRRILSIGIPVALQDGLIQVSFLVITAIADSRGVDIAAAVGIVEKIISFLFLVPSAMLSTISALSSGYIGAGKRQKSKKCLWYGIRICVIYGALIFLISQVLGRGAVSLFVPGNRSVITYGTQYLRTYSLDTLFAGVQFCFSGYFCARGKSLYAFLHNVLSIALVRIPAAFLASVLFPDNLAPMGLAAPMGSLLSILICTLLYRHLTGQDASRQ